MNYLAGWRNQREIDARLFADESHKFIVRAARNHLAVIHDTNVVRELLVAMAGGAVRGAAQVGALEVFEENGIEFDVVAGTSAGSFGSGLKSVCQFA